MGKPVNSLCRGIELMVPPCECKASPFRSIAMVAILVFYKFSQIQTRPAETNTMPQPAISNAKYNW